MISLKLLEKIILKYQNNFYSDEPMSYDLIKESIKSSIKNIKVINYFNYFKSSLTKTKKDIEEIKTRYIKEPKIYIK